MVKLRQVPDSASPKEENEELPGELISSACQKWIGQERADLPAKSHYETIEEQPGDLVPRGLGKMIQAPVADLANETLGEKMAEPVLG
jgi:hypothetical protein